jgi:hypothetical protein
LTDERQDLALALLQPPAGPGQIVALHRPQCQPPSPAMPGIDRRSRRVHELELTTSSSL